MITKISKFGKGYHQSACDHHFLLNHFKKSVKVHVTTKILSHIDLRFEKDVII